LSPYVLTRLLRSSLIRLLSVSGIAFNILFISHWWSVTPNSCLLIYGFLNKQRTPPVISGSKVIYTHCKHLGGNQKSKKKIRITPKYHA
jgi:hypothetical protein